MKAKPHSNSLTRYILRSNSPFGRRWTGLTLFFRKVTWRLLRETNGFAKRVFDLLVALVALFIAAPLMLVIALLVKSDGGPIFFRQVRVGLNGREFQMWKFRSMCIDAEEKLAALLEQNQKGGGSYF